MQAADLSPYRRQLDGGAYHDGRGLFVATHQDVAEFVAGRCLELAKEEIIDDDEISRFQLAAAHADLAEFARFDQVFNELMRFAVDDLVAALHGEERQRFRDVTLPAIPGHAPRERVVVLAHPYRILDVEPRVPPRESRAPVSPLLRKKRYVAKSLAVVNSDGALHMKRPSARAKHYRRGSSLSCIVVACTVMFSACSHNPQSPNSVTATQLVFSLQPANTAASAVISPAVVVTATDGSGTTATSFVGTVTLAVGLNPGSSTLSGTRSVVASGGVATFNNISLNNAAAGYTLIASSPQLTLATSAVFTVTALKIVFDSLTAGYEHTCGLSAGVAYCWGDNVEGSLGIGTATPTQLLTPTAVAGTLKFTKLWADSSHTCGLTQVGSMAYCWGSNYSSQLGVPGAPTFVFTPNQVGTSLTFTSLAAGSAETCGLTALGVAYCWGDNSPGVTTGTAIPTPVPGTFVFASLTAGSWFTCGLVGGKAYCWGYNGNGQLGDGGPVNLIPTIPTAVLTSLTFTSLTAGFAHTCGVDVLSSMAYCWGANSSGQLGDGSTTSHSSPTPVKGILVFTSLTAGLGHTCGLSAGVAYCWGDNTYGQLGTGTTGGQALVPTAVFGTLVFTSLTAGYYHTCGMAAGVAYCWGDNSFGAVGDNTTTNRNVPTPVSGQ